MARGKQTCKILKEIHRQIADANGIEFATSECRYLEQQLRARSIAGKAIALAGISVGMILMLGCSGTTLKSQHDNALLKKSIKSPERIEEIEEGEMPILEDTISSRQPENLIGVNKNGIIEKNETVKPQGEIIDPGQEDYIYEAIVDVRPTFPGGDKKLMEWISQHIQYPQNAYDAHIQGRVIAQILVKDDGSIGDAKIARSVFPSLDEEALRIVTTLPKFNPAILEGKAFEYWFTIPITFRLEDDLKSHEKAKTSAIIATQCEINDAPTTKSDENKIIYQAVEQMPEYPGGPVAMLKFIGDNLNYPIEMADDFQGNVRVKFYVDTLGHVCDPQIVRGLDSALDREVLRVVSLFPEFIPGQHEGKKVNVYINLPISFDPNRY